MNKYRIEGEVAWIALTQGRETCIDLKNLPTAFADCSWYAQKDRKTFYAATKVRKGGKRVKVYLHHLLFGKGYDHKDRNGLNNLEENLRPASQQQQNQNKGLRSDNSSGFKGVSWVASRDKWCAQIKLSGKNHHLGYFASKEEAARAYDAAALELFGDFARLNFPSPGQFPTQPSKEHPRFRGP